MATGKTPPRRPRVGKHTGRNTGMTQSSFGGYATPPPAAPPATEAVEATDEAQDLVPPEDVQQDGDEDNNSAGAQDVSAKDASVKDEPGKSD